jgi:hypothetical protein
MSVRTLKPDEYVTGWQEIAKHIGVTVRTAQKWCRKGKLPFYVWEKSGRPMIIKTDWQKIMRGKNMLITELEKNPNEKIRVCINEYRNSMFVDCRVYYQDDKGEWKPTKKGIALNTSTIDGVIEALQKAKEQLEA